MMLCLANQRFMSAVRQIHFHRRREPPQLESLAIGNEERRLGLVIFRADGLHGCIRQPARQRHHAGGIAAEHPVGESVDAIERQLHPLQPATEMLPFM